VLAEGHQQLIHVLGAAHPLRVNQKVEDLVEGEPAPPGFAQID
jgi:hypothetical protein